MHPIAFHLGPLTVYWYGILVALGFILGFWTASRRGLLDGIVPDRILDLGPWLLAGSVVGARLLHVISYWKEEFAGHPFREVFMVQNGGLVFYGGFLGACLTTIVYARIKKLPLWKLADAMAPSIALGYFFGRFGCLMTGCCFGKECSLPWAIHFPSTHETHGVGVHPTQIYEAVANLGLYFFLAWRYRRKTFDGQIFATYLVCYAVLRSVIEVFRADYKPNEYFGAMTPAQLLSAGIVAAGILLFCFLPRTVPPRKEPS